MLVVAGCGPRSEYPMAPVHGKIVYKGKPVPTGTVMFVPERGPAAISQIAEDGSYRLTTDGLGDGAVLGQHKITITALADMASLLPEQRSGTPAPLVPAKYLSDATSGLTAEVKSGDNEVNLELTDK